MQLKTLKLPINKLLKHPHYICNYFLCLISAEFRALFLTTLWNIDWPSSGWDAPSTQQAELRSYLDLMRDSNFNALQLQVQYIHHS